MRAVVTAYVGEASPVSSGTLASLLPVSLSAPSIRNTLGELEALGLVEKPHASAGRVPTESGLRVFVDRLLFPSGLVAYEQREIAGTVDDADAASLMRVASLVLSERTRQLGFVLSPRVDRLVLRHVSLVRLASDKVLVILISANGVTHQRVVHDAARTSQPELERIARALNDRLQGRTLKQLRDALADEAASLRERAGHILRSALELGVRVAAADAWDPAELVIATRRALLDQPEFRDPDRVRELFAAIETNEELVAYIDRVLGDRGVCVVFGDEVGEPALRRCALVTAPYGVEGTALGRLGVLGPSRMDYSRVIPLVEYLSKLVSERLAA